MFRLHWLLVCVSAPFLAQGQDIAVTEGDTSAMAEARAVGATALQLAHNALKGSDKPEFPGIQAWLAKEGKVLGALDKDKPDNAWRKLDPDKLVTHNPNFWQMFYEIVPGDPGLTMLHTGSLMAAGDADRAQVILRLALHRGDLNKKLSGVLISVMRNCSNFQEDSSQLVHDGITLHDKQDYAGALAKYDAALRLWPRNGWAAYERGTTFLIMDAGSSERVARAFAQCRELQPLQFRAWQGKRADIPGMTEMLTELSPLWDPSLQDINHVMTPEDLLKLSELLQLAEVDDLALVTRQVYVVRRGRYMPDDHPFISKSLRRLVPGPQGETTIAKLGGAGLTLAQIVQAPVPGEVK